MRNTDFQFQSPGYDWQKNNKKKKDTGNCKAFCVLCKRRKKNSQTLLFLQGLDSLYSVHLDSYIGSFTKRIQEILKMRWQEPLCNFVKKGLRDHLLSTKDSKPSCW